MLEGKSKNISSFLGDSAYDDLKFRGVLDEKTRQVIPPSKNAVVRNPKKGEVLPKHVLKRNEAVEYIQNHGVKQWKIEHGYHKRSLNETAMFRFKTELGARIIENQKAEALLKCLILNKFTGIGMPISEKVA